MDLMQVVSSWNKSQHCASTQECLTTAFTRDNLSQLISDGNDGRFWTLLHKVVFKGILPLVPKELLTTDMLGLRNSENETVLHFAGKYNSLASVPWVVVTPALFNMQDADGWSVLHWCAKRGELSKIPQYFLNVEALTLEGKEGEAPFKMLLASKPENGLPLGLEFPKKLDCGWWSETAWWKKNKLVCAEIQGAKKSLEPTLDTPNDIDIF